MIDFQGLTYFFNQLQPAKPHEDENDPDSAMALRPGGGDLAFLRLGRHQHFSQADLWQKEFLSNQIHRQITKI